MIHNDTTPHRASTSARAAQLLSRRRSTPTGIPRLEEVAVLALASTRLTRAITLDEITAPLRDRLARQADTGSWAWVWASRLLSCPACVGWWVSLAISFMLPGRRRLLRGASIGGAQILLALVERLVSEEGRGAISSADLTEARVADRKAPELIS